MTKAKSSCKLPVEVIGLSILFLKNGKDWPLVEPSEATSVVLHNSYERVEFRWPEEAHKARAMSKMIRDARGHGERSKADEICAALGINDEARS